MVATGLPLGACGVKCDGADANLSAEIADVYHHRPTSRTIQAPKKSLILQHLASLKPPDFKRRLITPCRPHQVRVHNQKPIVRSVWIASVVSSLLEVG